VLLNLQPSVEISSRGIGGFGCPNPIHKENMRLKTKLAIAPLWLHDGKNIPRVYKPNIGPPTTPKIVRAACRKINFIEKEILRLGDLISQKSIYLKPAKYV